MKKETLEEQLFGGDDYENLSDLEFDMDKKSESPESSDYESEVEVKKKKSKKRIKKSEEKNNEEKKVAKKQRRRTSNNENSLKDAESNLEEEQNILPVLKDFDKILEANKNKKKKRDFDVVEMDEIIIKLAQEMREAAEKDIEANENDKPALSKIKLLPKVIQFLEKSFLHEQLIDNEILEPIRIWLEPLEDGSLPSLSIRRPLLELLRKMPIAPEDLRQSKLGRVVMHFYKCEDEIPELRRKAGELVRVWSRSLIAGGELPVSNNKSVDRSKKEEGEEEEEEGEEEEVEDEEEEDEDD